MLKDGELVIFPTDTVYGLGCKLFDFEGLKEIYRVKQRDIGKQIPVLISELASSLNLLTKYKNRDITIMKNFWPGALTLILNSSDYFYKKTGQKTIAIRIPDHYIASKLLDENGPLWVTSCNISNQEPLNDITKIKETFSNDVKHIYYEKADNNSNISSTILDLTGDDIIVIRQGDITLEQIQEVLEKQK